MFHRARSQKVGALGADFELVDIKGCICFCSYAMWIAVAAQYAKENSLESCVWENDAGYWKEQKESYKTKVDKYWAKWMLQGF